MSNAAVSPNFKYGTVSSPSGYAANGAISSLTLGNTVVESTTFNPRFQPTDINAKLGTTTLLDLSYFYCTPPLHTACTNNNGNVQSQAITRGSQIWTQTYGYTDGINRLNSATEAITGSAGWSESYTYDNVGNRSVPTPAELSNEIPQAQSWYTANSVTNNRVIAWTYDNAGNIQSIPLIGRSSTYDAENRQKSVTVNGVASNYTYDSDGHRITKSVGGAAATTYVYDPNGQLAAEYGTATDPDGGTRFLDADALGTTRLKADVSATILNCYDFLPFGQELLAGTDARPSCFATPPDSFNLKFTGKERDAESGLDYFGARYFSGPEGRFTGADAPFSDQDPSDPQSWNLFSYGRNNPLSNTDPTGMFVESKTPPPQCNDPWATCGSLSQLWSFLEQGTQQIVHTTQQAAHSTFQFLSASRNTGCLSATTAAGTVGGTAVGAVAGGGVLSLPGAVLGFGIGGTVGWGTGMISCMSSTGGTGGSSGTGGSGSRLERLHDRIRRLDPSLSPEERLEKIKEMLPSGWSFTETPTDAGTLLEGVRGEGIFVGEDGAVTAGRVQGGATISNPIRLLGPTE